MLGESLSLLPSYLLLIAIGKQHELIVALEGDNLIAKSVCLIAPFTFYTGGFPWYNLELPIVEDVQRQLCPCIGKALSIDIDVANRQVDFGVGHLRALRLNNWRNLLFKLSQNIGRRAVLAFVDNLSK